MSSSREERDRLHMILASTFSFLLFCTPHLPRGVHPSFPVLRRSRRRLMQNNQLLIVIKSDKSHKGNDMYLGGHCARHLSKSFHR